jgi:hypothetical protein
MEKSSANLGFQQSEGEESEGEPSEHSFQSSLHDVHLPLDLLLSLIFSYLN